MAIPLSARKLFCRGGDRLPLSSDVFRYFRSSDPDFGGLDFLSSIGSECLLVFCLVGSSARLSSVFSQWLRGFGIFCLDVFRSADFAPAAVNPSAWDFVGSGLGFGWDVLGSAWLSSCTQSQVDHLCIFQNEVDHLLQSEVDQEF